MALQPSLLPRDDETASQSIYSPSVFNSSIPYIPYIYVPSDFSCCRFHQTVPSAQYVTPEQMMMPWTGINTAIQQYADINAPTLQDNDMEWFAPVAEAHVRYVTQGCNSDHVAMYSPIPTLDTQQLNKAFDSCEQTAQTGDNDAVHTQSLLSNTSDYEMDPEELALSLSVVRSDISAQSAQVSIFTIITTHGSASSLSPTQQPSSLSNKELLNDSNKNAQIFTTPIPPPFT
ncbi:hypothetical protein HD806DRAFT_525818 [Xylariaceae sp. AK1471]|nr:hypothetical protein HD806DRAFT_525818 [Xylariaceae sp. AK1471]